MITNFILGNMALVYILVGMSTGYNTAYRIVKLRKLSRKEFFLALITLPISFISWFIAMTTLLAFRRKVKVERMKFQEMM